jgi:hypothetical protein
MLQNSRTIAFQDSDGSIGAMLEEYRRIEQSKAPERVLGLSAVIRELLRESLSAKLSPRLEDKQKTGKLRK